MTPLEEAELVRLRVDDQGDLPRLLEVVLVNEEVVAREENAEARVRVVPADDVVVRVFLLDFLPRGRPRFVREGERRRPAFGADRRDEAADFDVLPAVLVQPADEEAADLRVVTCSEKSMISSSTSS